MKSKPVQIAVALSRTEHEQHGVETLFVLLDDGRIFHRETAGGNCAGWDEIRGPWVAEAITDETRL